MHIPQDIYAQIVRFMPIPCVDLLVEDTGGRILLIMRANDPAKGQWWFPGGRVHFGETRRDAAIRKLHEECGLAPLSMQELGTYDLMLDLPEKRTISHAISTVFHVAVESNAVSLDKQSSAYLWKPPVEWLKACRQDFVELILSQIVQADPVTSYEE